MTEPFKMVDPYDEPIKAAGVFFGKAATCDICGKELFDKKNMEEHYREDHPYLTSG